MIFAEGCGSYSDYPSFETRASLVNRRQLQFLCYGCSKSCRLHEVNELRAG